jgi:hypothetical protein
MFNPPSVVNLVSALAGATGYAATDPASDEVRPRELRDRAGASIRSAQVELYCDHPSTAVVAIRQATHELMASSDHAAATALAALAEARWHVRHHHTGEAVAALDDAMARLAA